MKHRQYRQCTPLGTQRGQALVLGLFLAMLLAVALIYQFGVGQVVGRKARLMHATDAAAYSGALIQARALNMQAYINLTQTAHQVAMAHLVTLGSWSLFAAAQGQQLAKFNPPAHVIGMMFGARHLTGYTASSSAMALRNMARSGGKLPRLFAEHDRIVRHVLQSASHAIHQSMQSTRDRAITQVLEQNFPDSTVTQLLLPRQDTTAHGQTRTAVPVSYPPDRSAPVSWSARNHLEKSYTALHKPGAGYRRFLEDVVALYDFLGVRDHVTRNGWMVHYQCPHLRHELRRRGRTVLDSNGNWQSTDTLSYHALRSNQYIGCYYREYPMGWGWITAREGKPGADMPYSEEAPGNFGDIDFWRWVTQATSWDIFTGRANPLANSYAVAGTPQWKGGGLIPYYDLRQEHRHRPLGFTINVTQHFSDQPALTVVASAETFYELASQNRQYRTELAGMWHPFWQAHLVANPPAREN
ncbi:Tad domain-containing protein [Advenella sp. S44]|uniref:Tad domain-containing protein n=1 Tax=Advenella sp. S44 TaxID=1982755 RepID=UPI000C2A233E|nr:Tad domain-containing protein [Advenella sp. S44]